MAEAKDADQALIIQSEKRGVTAVYRSKHHLMLVNFLGGIAWGFGTVIGATIVVALVLYLLQALGGLPIIGSYINSVVDAVTRR
jgi:hypothetical protein